MSSDVLSGPNPGFAVLSRLFHAGLRARGMSYVGQRRITLEQSDAQVLRAQVRGATTYSTMFRREGSVLYYGCTCPYFVERHEPCKHLWALALEQSSSPLVRDAASAQRHVVDLGMLEGAGSTGDDGIDDEGPDDDDDLLDEDYFEEDDDVRVVPANRSRYDSEFRLVSRSWRDLALIAQQTEPSGRNKVELLYFLVPSMVLDELQILVGERRVGAAPEAFNPAQRIAPGALVHQLDRELHGMGLGSTAPASYYAPATAFGARVSAAMAPTILERLARTGRCHVVPEQRGAAWAFFSSGRHSSPKGRARLGYDLGELLSWPVLSLGTGEPFRLAVALADPSGSRRKRKDRELALQAELFRGEERRSLAQLRYLHHDGLALLGHELHALSGADAGWAKALAQRGADVRIPERELPEVLERLFGRRGVSALSLPPDYEQVAAPGSFRPVVDLQAPQGKRVRATVAFEYGGESVPAGRESRLVLSSRSVFERDRQAEAAALAELSRLGFEGRLLQNAKRPDESAVAIEEKHLAGALYALLAAGFLVQGEGRQYRKASGFNIEVESGIDWFEVKGGATFDQAEVPFPALLAAIKHKRKTVVLGDGSVGVLPEDWMQRWGLIAELAPERTGNLRFSSRQVGLVQALLSALPDEGVGSRSLSALRDKLVAFQSVKPAQPARGFRGNLRPYQEQGLGFLRVLGDLGFGVCLADDMGLGKTIQVLGHLWNARRRNKQRKPALVVVPRSLLSNWLDEAARFAPGLVVHQHWGPERQRTAQSFTDVDVVLTTYGTLRLDITLLREVNFAFVVLDEAQAIKNKHSATAKCAKLLRAERRIAMSGTPIENHLGELWSLFEFLNPGLLDELPGLRRALESPRPSEQALGLIRTLVRPFVLRRTKGEVAKDLPARVEQTLYVELDADERRLYDELLTHYQASIAKKVKTVGLDRATPHLLEALLRLRQAACHPGLIDGGRKSEQSSKVECLLEQLRELLREGHRALVFSQFTSLLGIVRQRLVDERIRFEYLDGKTRDRAGAVARFQEDPAVGVFLISLKAGGVGLNLTGADYVFILDPWWNPAAEAQAIDRTHRIGQTRSVIAYRLLAKDTVEERVAHLQDQKRELVADIMGDEASLSARLTRDDMQALLQLTSSDPHAGS